MRQKYHINLAILNAIFSSFSYIVTLILDIFLTFLLIKYYGSTLNGFVRVLFILIGLVAGVESAAGMMGTSLLFRPLQAKN